ncbi:MAG: gamma-glutamyltransferase [Bryobacterales bacterium]|nr:gamma-glutamyltransferase [Bryobacterales bacterium]
MRLVLFLFLLPLWLQAQSAGEPWAWRTVVMGTQGMVAAEHPLQARAGLKVLEAGGNAIDAAVAVFYVTAVTEQHQAGLGGDAYILAYVAGSKKVVFINGTGPAPKLATPEFYKQRFNGIPPNGIFSSNVPGAVSAFDLAHKRYGTKPYPTLLSDALEAAGKGHAMTHFAARTHTEVLPMLLRYPSSKAALTKDGRPFEPGDLLVQTDLAGSLKTLAAKGPAEFYRGSLARLTAATYRKYEGLIREEDLAAYTAEEAEPVRADYKGYTVLQAGGNSQGIVQLMAMNILKSFPIKQLGHNSPEYLHVLLEALKLAFADRDYYVSDPKVRAIPSQALLSDEYAAARAKLIRMDRAIQGVPPPGDPEKGLAVLAGRTVLYAAGPKAITAAAATPADGETSSFSIADRWGNVVSVTHSVNGTFGSGVVVEGGGYVLNNRLPYFSLDSQDVNVLAPGKLTRHTICPALALKNGKPVLAWNTPGGDNQPQALLQAFLNVVEFGMNPQQALEQASATTTSLHPSMYPHNPGDQVVLPKVLADKVGEALAAKGHKIQVQALQQPYFQQLSAVGAVKMVMVDPRTGVLWGAVSPAKDDYVMGW